MLVAPAHVHTPRQSNKARINNLLLFSSVTLTMCEHAHGLYKMLFNEYGEMGWECQHVVSH